MKRVMYPLDLGIMPECDSCGKCCGPVGITYEERDAIREYCEANKIEWEDREDLMCGFLAADNSCRIYEVRPFICRAYGVTVEMPCPRYPEAARTSMPPEENRRRGLVTYEGIPLSEACGSQGGSKTKSVGRQYAVCDPA